MVSDELQKDVEDEGDTAVGDYLRQRPCRERRAGATNRMIKCRVAVPIHPEFPDDDMGIPVSPEQGELEKDQAGAPDQVTAAELGQEYLGDDQLDLEKQKGRQEAECVQKMDFSHDALPIPQPHPPFNG